MTSWIFFASVLVTPLALGLPITACRTVSSLPPMARAAVVWATGTVVLTAVLTLLSSLGAAWNPFAVALVMVGAGSVWLRQRPRRRVVEKQRERVRPAVAAGAVSVGVAAVGLIFFASGSATSADLSYFWGVKAVLFAADRGLDFQQINLPHLIHLHPNYPPLWPVLLGWGTMVAGSLPWAAVPMLTWLWVVAAAVIAHGLLRPAVGTGAGAISCFWLAAVIGSTARSFSGGSAEGPLLFFVTVAITALSIESETGDRGLRWLAAAALAGAVLSKSEGVVAAVLLVGGMLVRDYLRGRERALRSAVKLAAPAAAAASLWFCVRLAHGLPLSDPIRVTPLQMDLGLFPEVLKTCTRLFGSDGLWAVWVFPILALSIAGRRSVIRAVPALCLAAGLPVFSMAYYLHASGNPVELIVWTFPRLIQPAISAWIIGLGVLVFDPRERVTLPATTPSDVPR